AQELLDLSRLDRLVIALDLRHRLANFLGADRPSIAAELTDRLLDEAEGAIQGESAASLLTRGCRSLGCATASTASAALAVPRPIDGASNRRLRRGTRHTGAEGDLVLPVVQLGESDQAPVGRLDHELREAREPSVLFVEGGIDLLHHLLQAVGADHVVVR